MFSFLGIGRKRGHPSSELVVQNKSHVRDKTALLVKEDLLASASKELDTYTQRLAEKTEEVRALIAECEYHKTQAARSASKIGDLSQQLIDTQAFINSESQLRQQLELTLAELTLQHTIALENAQQSESNLARVQQSLLEVSQSLDEASYRVRDMVQREESEKQLIDRLLEDGSRGEARLAELGGLLHAAHQRINSLSLTEEQLTQVIGENSSLTLTCADLGGKLSMAKLLESQLSQQLASSEQLLVNAISRSSRLESELLCAQTQAKVVARDNSLLTMSLGRLSEEREYLVRALDSALGESDQLFMQLYHLQEELDLHRRHHADFDYRLRVSNDRLGRLLIRLPNWADAEIVECSQIDQVAAPDHSSPVLRVTVTNLWVGLNKSIPKLIFSIGQCEDDPFLEIYRIDANEHFLPWDFHSGDPENGYFRLAKDSYLQVAQLNAFQWRIIRNLLFLCTAQADRILGPDIGTRGYWLNLVNRLASILEHHSTQLRYDRAEALTPPTATNSGFFVRLALMNIEFGAYRNKLVVLDVLLTVSQKNKKIRPNSITLLFRSGNGSRRPFTNWVPNGADELGDYVAYKFQVGDSAEVQAQSCLLGGEDGLFLRSCVAALPVIIEELAVDIDLKLLVESLLTLGD